MAANAPVIHDNVLNPNQAILDEIAVNEPRASTTRSICDQEPLLNEQYLKSNRGFLKYVESVKHE